MFNVSVEDMQIKALKGLPNKSSLIVVFFNNTFSYIITVIYL